MRADHEEVTADGLVVHVGDTVWRAMLVGYPRQVTVTKTYLYWMRCSRDEYFATREAAFAAAIDRATAALKQARIDVRRETNRIAELKRRAKVGCQRPAPGWGGK